MPSRRFQTTRRTTRKDEAPETDASETSFSLPPVSVAWLIERMGFDFESFVSDPDSARHMDTEVVIETVAIAHADAGFPSFLAAWDDRYDHQQDGKSFTGRLVAASLTSSIDWPLGRSWFHDVYVDLARLDGALGIELASEPQLRHAVACYWKRIGILSSSHAAANQPEPSPGTDAGQNWRETEPTTPMKQLALF
ncbi:hypothetical protein G6L37_05275 [Agrobacterium rubi]|nr:hypothetical protein [Agrobacterium rubi]NTF24768.1 hypothetical protein [Agrobacterium rubi]